MTSLIGKFDRVAGTFHQTATVIREGQILLAFAVGDIECIRCKCDWDNKDLNRTIRILLNCFTRKKLQRIRSVSTADRNIGVPHSWICLSRLNIKTCHQEYN